MRSFGLTFIAVLLLTPLARGQASENANDQAKLDRYLRDWEARMGSIQSLYAEVKRTELSKLRGIAKEMTGSARYVKPNKARLRLNKEGDPDTWELYLTDGKALYQFDPKSKLIQVHQIPKNQGNNVGNDTFLSFLFGMKPGEAKKRYGLALDHEDDWYIYVNIFPKLGTDKQEFTKAQMVFYKKPEAQAMLPRRLWFQHPNGDETTWEFKKILPNVKLKATDFVLPATPKDWKVIQANAPKANSNPAPRVVRPRNQ